MATFGYTSIGTSNAPSSAAGNTYANLYSLGENGDISKLTKYGLYTGIANNEKGLIYSETASYPDALQSPVGDITAAPSSASWYDLPFSSNITLITGDWRLGWVQQNADVIRYYYDTGSTNQRYLKSDSSYWGT